MLCTKSFSLVWINPKRVCITTVGLALPLLTMVIIGPAGSGGLA